MLLCPVALEAQVFAVIQALVAKHNQFAAMLAASDVALLVDIPIRINIFLFAEGANFDCFCLNCCVHIYLLLIVQKYVNFAETVDIFISEWVVIFTGEIPVEIIMQIVDHLVFRSRELTARLTNYIEDFDYVLCLLEKSDDFVILLTAQWERIDVGDVREVSSVGIVDFDSVGFFTKNLVIRFDVEHTDSFVVDNLPIGVNKHF
jgi:hypothetical protein